MERKRSDEQRHGKPDPRKAGITEQRSPSDAAGQFRDSRFDGDNCCHGNSERFANDKPEQYSNRDFGILKRTTYPDAGIGECEQGITTNAEKLCSACSSIRILAVTPTLACSSANKVSC
jgi:hypothetical protein